MNPDERRLAYTFRVAIAGIVAVLVAFGIAILVFRDSSDPGQTIAAVLGTVTAVIGTLAGLVAGQTAGAAGKEAAEARAATAEERHTELLRTLRDRYPEVFRGEVGDSA